MLLTIPTKLLKKWDIAFWLNSSQDLMIMRMFIRSLLNHINNSLLDHVIKYTVLLSKKVYLPQELELDQRL